LGVCGSGHRPSLLRDYRVMSNGRSPQIRVRRSRKRARYHRESVYWVLDRGRVAHVAFVDGGRPFCIPTLYARAGDRLLIHGSSASRMVRRLSARAPACVTVTILDGLVLARSAFEHSVNYDSAVLLGTFEPISDPRREASCPRGVPRAPASRPLGTRCASQTARSLGRRRCSRRRLARRRSRRAALPRTMAPRRTLSSTPGPA
jgi:Pyridoxamine 5'-phosphate oxidase